MRSNLPPGGSVTSISCSPASSSSARLRDELIAMENVAHAGARRAAASSSSEASTNPNASPISPQVPASAILLPPDLAPIDMASPVETVP